MGPAHSLRAGPRTIRRGQSLAAHGSLRALGRDRCPGQAVTLNSMETAAAPAAAGHHVTQAHDPARTHPDLLQCPCQEACGGASRPLHPLLGGKQAERLLEPQTRSSGPFLRRLRRRHAAPWIPHSVSSIRHIDGARSGQGRRTTAGPLRHKLLQVTAALDEAGHVVMPGSANHTVRSSPITASRRLLASRAGRW